MHSRLHFAWLLPAAVLSGRSAETAGRDCATGDYRAREDLRQSYHGLKLITPALAAVYRMSRRLSIAGLVRQRRVKRRA